MHRWRASRTAVFFRETGVSVIQHDSAKEYTSTFLVNFNYPPTPLPIFKGYKIDRTGRYFQIILIVY
jgi:hypothetical protein